MKSYIISIACVSVICSLASLLSPEGEGGGIGKQIRLISALVLTVVCISPVAELVKSISAFDPSSLLSEIEEESGDKYGEIFDGAFELSEEKELKYRISEVLWEEFGISDDECSVSFVISEGKDGRVLEKIFILLRGSAIWKDTGEIERYLYGIFGCEIIMAIE